MESTFIQCYDFVVWAFLLLGDALALWRSLHCCKVLCGDKASLIRNKSDILNGSFEIQRRVKDSDFEKESIMQYCSSNNRLGPWTFIPLHDHLPENLVCNSDGRRYLIRRRRIDSSRPTNGSSVDCSHHLLIPLATLQPKAVKKPLQRPWLLLRVLHKGPRSVRLDHRKQSPNVWLFQICHSFGWQTGGWQKTQRIRNGPDLLAPRASVSQISSE